MPMLLTSALGRLARKLVNDSRMVHSSGKMLMASKISMVGPMNSHAIERSDKPRSRDAIGKDVA